MKPLPLRLALDPLLPSRTPNAGEAFRYGYRLRLPRGPALRSDDPLLPAFGASIELLGIDDDDEETLQADEFEPGRELRLVPGPFDPDDVNAIGVWDAEGLRQAGTLPEEAAEVVAAAIEAGLEQRGLVLTELRAVADDRRIGLALLVYAPSLVRVRIPRTPRFDRPIRPSRQRLVLVADGSGNVHWWDPSATSCPLEVADLPLSQELRQELRRLHDAFAALGDGDGEDEQRGFERMEFEWEREMLDSKAAALWRRARAELGRRYAVGFLGSGMRRPVWSPSELDSATHGCGSDADIPF